VVLAAHRYGCNRSADCGPKWGPGVDVDVIVRLSAGDGAAGYLKALGVAILRTD